MILIGENLNIMSKKIGEAIKQKDPVPIRELARKQTEAGMDMLDINIGPARKDGPELMEWVVRTVREATDMPLSLDTSNIEAIEAGLRLIDGSGLINSISARPERIEALMPLAKRYSTPFIALLLGVEGIPRDANERAMLAVEMMMKAQEHDIPEGNIWIDPIVLPVNSQQIQVQGCTEFAAVLREIAPVCKSVCGLSNVSNGVPQHLRGVMNRTYLIILKRYGMHSAIVDAFDEELKAIAHDGRPDIEALVYKIMDGELVDLSTLSQEEASYCKTTRVLLGQTVYSDSWLEL